MVTAARSAKLTLGRRLQRLQKGDGPETVVVQHGMVLRVQVVARRPEDGMVAQHPHIGLTPVRELGSGHVEDGERHPAADVDTYTVGDHHALSGQHPADGQPVADMCIRHQRPAHSHRQPHRHGHLVDRRLVDPPAAEDLEGDTLGQQVHVETRRRRTGCQPLGQRRQHFVTQPRLRRRQEP